MSAVGQAFINAFGAPNPAAPSMPMNYQFDSLHPEIGSGWFRDGFLYLHGRADGVINRGGFKIHPSAIESVLLQHPAVAACSVVGIPHERLGWVPVAAVELRPGAPEPTVAEIDAFLRKGLPATNIPTDYRIVGELPRTTSHKIRLDGVRAMFAPVPA